jgi:hypothetical protein
MHNTPLTLIEREGLEKHGLPIGKPSQLSDTFRLGVAWALAQQVEPFTSAELVRMNEEYRHAKHPITKLNDPEAAPQAQQAEPVAYRVWSSKWHEWEFETLAVPNGEPLYTAPAPQAQQEPVAECVDDREGIDDVDRELLSKVSKALAYYSNGDPIRDFIDTDDMVAAMQLLMRVVPDGDRLEAVASFVAGYRTGYEAEPPKHMTDAAGGMK